MKVISTGHSPEQLKKDMPKLLQAHGDAMRQDAMWGMFGGILTIEGRNYQVVNQ